MGRETDGYDGFYLNEITNYFHELPQEEKCFKSLLTKDNILKYKKDTILAKKLQKKADR